MANAQSVEVKEGVTEKLNISARRIAYSCFGNIHSLNGEPEKFITVEAVSAAGDLEEVRMCEGEIEQSRETHNS